MKANEFIKLMDSGSLRHAYCFTGPEEWVKQEAVKRLREKLLPPGLEGFNDTTLDQPALKEIIEAADTLPVMCDKRIVVARDWAPLKQTQEKDVEKELSALEAWLAQPIDTSVTIFYNHGSVTSKALLNLFQKHDAVVQFDELTEREIMAWANRRLKPDGKRIASDAIVALIDRVGSDLTRLSIELEKLSAYTDARDTITVQDVETVVPQSLEQRIYELTGYLLDGDIARANVFLDTLIKNGEDCFGILGFLTQQLRQLCHIRLSLDAGLPTETLLKPLNIRNERALFPLTKRSRRLSAEVFKRLYMELVDLDYSVKSGAMRDIEAVEMALIKIGTVTKQSKGRRAS